MIRVSHKNIETPLILDSGSPAVLSIENSKEYYNFVTEFEKAFSGEESKFSFWNGNESVSPEKQGEIIVSPFYFEMTDKKIVNLLYKKLQNNFNDGAFITEFNEINAKIETFLYDLCSTVDFSLGHECVSLESLLKVCSVKPSETYDNLLEKLICYINIFTELKAISFFVLVGVTDVLSEEELILLYRHCELNKIELLLVERGRTEKRGNNERKIIITEDLCEIVENFPEIY